MSLIQCYECKGQISSHAVSCPHCGALAKENQVTRERREKPKVILTVVVLLGLGFTLAMGQLQKEAEVRTVSVEVPRVEVAASPAKLAQTQTQICKAAMALLMLQPPEIITAKWDNGVVSVNYTRPDDNTTWRSRCKVEGDRVVWASETGRWRTDTSDPQVHFEIDRDNITVREHLGAETYNQKTYAREALR